MQKLGFARSQWKAEYLENAGTAAFYSAYKAAVHPDRCWQIRVFCSGNQCQLNQHMPLRRRREFLPNGFPCLHADTRKNSAHTAAAAKAR